jgi:hypothetical protein
MKLKEPLDRTTSCTTMNCEPRRGHGHYVAVALSVRMYVPVRTLSVLTALLSTTAEKTVSGCRGVFVPVPVRTDPAGHVMEGTYVRNQRYE